VLDGDPFSGHLFLFRGKRADYLKVLYYDGTGLCLFAARSSRHALTNRCTLSWAPS
jgi:transposase